MGVLKTTKFWRGLGAVLDTGVGSAVAGATGQLVNRMISATAGISLDGEVPWTPVSKPLAESTVALVSTGGFYLDGDEPFDIDADRGDPTFRSFPSEVDLSDLRIAHTHYTHRYVNADRNVLLPLEHLREGAEAGAFRLAPTAHSFGFGGDLTTAYIEPPDGTAHQLVRALAQEQVDLMLLVPA